MTYIFVVFLKDRSIVKVDNLHMHRADGTVFLFTDNQFKMVSHKDIESILIMEGEKAIG